MLQSVFKSSGRSIPTQQLRRQWDGSLARFKENLAQKESVHEKERRIERRRLVREFEENRHAEKLTQEGRARARRNLLEERYRMFRRMYWEWAASAYRNYPQLKEGWEKSDYQARRAYAWPMMHNIVREVGALPC